MRPHLPRRRPGPTGTGLPSRAARDVPPARAGGTSRRAAAALAVLGLAAFATNLAAGASAAPPAPVLGPGEPLPCSTAVSYSVGDGRRVTRALPAPASRAGGATLAAPGLHVSPSAVVPPPSPLATAWVVADLATGQVLAACNAHVPLGPASCLKVLTALALLPLIGPARRYTARSEDARVIGT